MPGALLENYITKVLGKKRVMNGGNPEMQHHERMKREAQRLMDKFGKEDYIKHHALRYAHSLDWLASISRENPMQVAELGGGWPFNEMYRQRFAGDNIQIISSDLRFLNEDLQAGKLAMSPNSQDLVLCMEVLEHIHDQLPPEKLSDLWSGDGAMSMMKGAWNLLKPNGLLFLTTPNACSRIVMRQLFHMGAPYFYRNHVREYSPNELRRLVTENGFAILRMETVDAWEFLGVESEYRAFDEFMSKNGFPMTERGDDMMVIARKPATKATFKVIPAHR